MAGLRAHFSQLLPKLLLAFWLTSTVTMAIVIALPLLQKQLADEPLQPQFGELLQRVAARMDQDPSLTLQQVNQQLHRPESFEQLLSPRNHDGRRPPPPSHDDQRQGRPRPPRVQLFLVDDSGNSLSPNARRLPRPVREFMLDIGPNSPMRQQRLGKSLVFGPQPLANGQLLIGRTEYLNKPWLFELLQRPWLLLVLATIVSTLVFGALAWTLSTPLRQLRQATAAVARGELDARIDDKISNRSDEIGQLGRSFNLMANSVSTMVIGQQRLLSDISHELRTPLTRLKLSLAIAQRKGQSSEELTRIETEADQLEAMLQELLALSRLNLQVTDRKAELDLIETFQPVLDGAQFEAQELNKIVVVTQPATLPFYGIDTLLQRMLENPLRNALRHAKNRVRLTIRERHHHIEIEVIDDGEGVPTEQLESIFKPFHRVDQARNRNNGGWGLGLAISSGATHAHQGSISASNHPDGGLKITIQLPKPQ